MIKPNTILFKIKIKKVAYRNEVTQQNKKVAAYYISTDGEKI